MMAATIALTAGYVALALLLIGLQLRSAWPWPLKAAAILLTLPAFVATFVAIEALQGWPSAANPPADFQLHAALVREPARAGGAGGAIHLWLTPLAPAAHAAGATMSEEASLPRAFTLPYSRDLHSRIEAMRARLQKGDPVAGRRVAGSAWRRRFGQQDGLVDLYAPPPPPLPAKDG